MTTWRLGPYRALEHVFVVDGVDSEPVRERLEHALAPLASPNDPAPEMAYRVTPMGAPSTALYRLTYGTRLIAKGQSAFYAAGLVLWQVNQRAVTEDRGRHLVLHAAAAERDGLLVVLLGDSGVGKTTTIAGLLQAGFSYVTDEALALDRTTFAATPFPKALALNADVAPLFPGVGSPDRPRTAEPVLHVPWWELGSPGVSRGLVPSLVVALTKGGEGLEAGASRELNEGNSALALAASTFRLRSRPRQNLEAAAALAASTPALTLATGEVATSVTQIGSWLDSVASGTHPVPSGQPQIDELPGQETPPPVLVEPDGRYEPVRGLTVVETGPGIVLRDPASGYAASLGGTAIVIWAKLDGRASLSDIIEGLAAGYAAPIGVVRADVESLVARLVGLGLLRQVGRP